jgi:hypothetical protein
MKRLIYSLLAITIIGACSKNEPFSNEGEILFTSLTSSDCDSVVFVPLDLIDYKTDPFEMKGVSIVDNNLMLQVQYGGGCGEADFSLLVNEAFMESSPVQVQAVVIFNDNDMCKAIVTRELCFDLTELAELYQASYQTSHGSIIIRISGYSSVLYTF